MLKCAQWVDLATVQTTVAVSGVELCVSPCNSVVWYLASMECEVRLG